MPHRPVLRRQLTSPFGKLSIAAERTGNHIHREQNRTERGHSREHVVDLVVRVCHLDRDLCEVVGVRAREELFVVIQALRHGDQVVLDVGEVQALSK